MRWNRSWPPDWTKGRYPSSSRTMKSIRVKCSASRPCRPLRVSISRRLTRSTTLKKRPRAPDRMQLLAIAMARWVLPVPVQHDVALLGDEAAAGEVVDKVSQHRLEDVDHLPIAIIGAGKPAPDPPDCGWQYPVLEGSAIAQGAGFACQHRHIVPEIVGRLAASKGSWMLRNDASILTDQNAIGVSLDLDRAPNGAGCDRVLVVVEANQTGLRDRCRHRMEAVEPAGIGNELGAFGFEHLPDRLIGQLRMAMSLGVGDAFVEQPGVYPITSPSTQPISMLSHPNREIRAATRRSFGLTPRCQILQQRRQPSQGATDSGATSRRLTRDSIRMAEQNTYTADQ